MVAEAHGMRHVKHTALRHQFSTRGPRALIDIQTMSEMLSRYRNNDIFGTKRRTKRRPNGTGPKHDGTARDVRTKRRRLKRATLINWLNRDFFIHKEHQALKL